MQVKRNFDAVYEAEEDPWAIGDANSDRYTYYYTLIQSYLTKTSTVLDIGCGQGAFLARFQHDAGRLLGVEYAAEGVRRARERFPFIEMYQGSATSLATLEVLHEERFDIIIFSDVICYLSERHKIACLRWISEHLSPNGVAFIAAYCPGKDYLYPWELKNLVLRDFDITFENFLPTEHALFLCKKKVFRLALTFDYETWHPIPDGKVIDWENDMLKPAAELMDVAGEEGVPLTFFVEMAEVLWLQQNDSGMARRIEDQIRTMWLKGHDVQLHLHPSWLPELGASCLDGVWTWNWHYMSIADYPGDLTVLIARLKNALERIIAPVNPDYRVTCFRAGAYSCQPFKPLYDALSANGILVDSSVYPGAASAERRFDFSHPYSSRFPYFASAFTPQFKAPPAEEIILELPISVVDGERLQLDGCALASAAQRIIALADASRKRVSSEQMRWAYRIKTKVFPYTLGFQNVFSSLLQKKKVRQILHTRRWLARVFMWGWSHLAQWNHWLDVRYPAEISHTPAALVAIGHTKCCASLNDIRHFIRGMHEACVSLVPMSKMAELARRDLSKVRNDESAAALLQINREYNSVMQAVPGRKQSHYLQGLLPLDRRKVLDLGCGSGQCAGELAFRYPWITVTGVDAGEAFIRVAKERYASERVAFQQALFTQLPFCDGLFDTVYADNALEHAFDIQHTLAEVYRVLCDNGCLIAAVPPDALNPQRSCDNHTWKTCAFDVKLRLEDVGFTDILIEDKDVCRELGESPFPPSFDRMLYVTAWKRIDAVSQLERAECLQKYLYDAIECGTHVGEQRAETILSDGIGLCADYACALHEALRREGIVAKIWHIHMHNHPRGRGENKEDTHTLVEATLDGRVFTMDPTLNLIYSASIEELVKSPDIADDTLRNKIRDERWERGYDLYSAGSAWRSVVKITS